MFKAIHEGVVKDVERAFDVLKKRWHIIDNLIRSLEPRRTRDIMYACII